MKIKEEIQKLKTMDIYSFMLFALFKIRDIPEYSALSELAYVLDKDSLLKLCEYFGGLTITIPTVDEFETLVLSLLMYQYVDQDKMSYDKAVKLIEGCTSTDIKQIKASYIKIKELLDNYEFSTREKA